MGMRELDRELESELTQAIVDVIIHYNDGWGEFGIRHVAEEITEEVLEVLRVVRS